MEIQNLNSTDLHTKLKNCLSGLLSPTKSYRILCEQYISSEKSENPLELLQTLIEILPSLSDSNTKQLCLILLRQFFIEKNPSCI